MNKHIENILFEQIKSRIDNPLAVLAMESMPDKSEIITTYVDEFIIKSFHIMKTSLHTNDFIDSDWFRSGFYIALEMLNRDAK